MNSRPTLFFAPMPWLTRACVALVVAATLGLIAEAAQAQAGAVDPPGRVARLSDVGGAVWLYHPDSGDWVQAARNLPLTTGDTLATDPGGRAELQVGSSTLRLDSGSEMQVVVLDDNRVSLQLRTGALAVRVRNAAETGPFDVTTEEGRFSVLAAGRYRFDRGTGSSFVGVDTGQVRYEYANSALPIQSGQRAEFWIDANGAAQYGLGAGIYDAFTAWNNERDRAADSSVAARYVSPEMTGVTDLDRYGSWEQSPDYGAVWIPTAVAAGWAPYSAGRWAWVQPWGWTWIDDAPWGFAPFHYGRWVNLRNRWCWTPGAREPRPVYAPALVGWVGGPRAGGPGGGGGPAVGWFPLAPREIYVPSYRSSPRYVRDINITHVRNVANINLVIGNPLAPREFENRRFPQAVTVVPSNVFTERRPVGPAAAQYRDAPWAREFAQRGGPAPALITPPVASPTPPGRQVETRPGRPAPGFVEERPANPGRGPRGREGDGGRGDAQQPADPRDRPGRPDRGGPVMSSSPPAIAPPVPTPAPAPMPAVEPSRVRPLPIRPGPNPGERPAQPGLTEGRPAGPALQPAAPPRAAQPAEAEAPQRVRPLPVLRGGERRGDEGRGADPRLPARNEPASPPPRPAMPPPAQPARPVEAPRPPERAAPTPPVERPQQQPRTEAAPARPEVVGPRPSEGQAPRGSPAPRPAEERRPAPSPAESQRVGGPERRVDPNSAR